VLAVPLDQLSQIFPRRLTSASFSQRIVQMVESPLHFQQEIVRFVDEFQLMLHARALNVVTRSRRRSRVSFTIQARSEPVLTRLEIDEGSLHLRLDQRGDRRCHILLLRRQLGGS
jgi:hypothetical protein